MKKNKYPKKVNNKLPTTKTLNLFWIKSVLFSDINPAISGNRTKHRGPKTAPTKLKSVIEYATSPAKIKSF